MNVNQIIMEVSVNTDVLATVMVHVIRMMDIVRNAIQVIMEISVISNVHLAAVMQVVYKIQVIVSLVRKDTMDLNVTTYYFVIPVSAMIVIKMVNANMGV